MPALVGDDGGDGLGRIALDEEPVQRGRGALGDGGGLMRGVGFVRVPAVDHPALRDVDAGSAAHHLRRQIPDKIRVGYRLPVVLLRASAALCGVSA